MRRAAEDTLNAQGTGDNFYKSGQLLPENFLKAARDAGYDEVQVRVRSQEGYDHSYYFVSAPTVELEPSAEHHIDVYVRRGSHPL